MGSGPMLQVLLHLGLPSCFLQGTHHGAAAPLTAACWLLPASKKEEEDS